MAKLNAAARRKLKTSQFALPEERAYPINDKAHAAAAKSRAAQFASPDQQKRINAKANKVLGKRGK